MKSPIRAAPWRRGGTSPLALLTTLLLSFSAAASDVPERYLVRGSATVAVDGPGCCDGTPLAGRFEAALEVDGSGGVLLTSFAVDLADQEVPVRGLLGIPWGTKALHCASVLASSPASGSVDPWGNLSFPTGAVPFEASSFKTRLDERRCGNPDLRMTGANGAPLWGRHEPWSDHFALSGTFVAAADSGTYDVSLRLDGRYVNRPPVAALGVVRPGSLQPDCPARFRPGNPPEWVAEANDPAGLKGSLLSLAWDPDGASGHSDVASDAWFLGTDGGPLTALGEGLHRGPVTFGFGPVHRIVLEATDRVGAAASAECRFRVVDSTPPYLSVFASPPSLPADGKWRKVAVTATAWDAVTALPNVVLESVDSDAPWLDAEDVADAAPGTDDRDLSLRGRTAKSGVLRTFRLTYRATDAAGNASTAVATVTVGPN